MSIDFDTSGIYSEPISLEHHLDQTENGDATKTGESQSASIDAGPCKRVAAPPHHLDRDRTAPDPGPRFVAPAWMKWTTSIMSGCGSLIRRACPVVQSVAAELRGW